MHSSVIHSPSDYTFELFDIGILLPAYREWVTPFHCLDVWLNTVSELEERYRVLILILVNWPSSDVYWNRVTLETWKKLSRLIQYWRESDSIDNEGMGILFDDLRLKICRNSKRVKIVLWNYYHSGNTIWMARHRWCTYLAEKVLPSWIIISTDSDSWPSQANYLKDAVTLFEDNPDIWWATGGFRCTLDNADTSDRTRQLYDYERICGSLYSTLISDCFWNDRIDSMTDLGLMPGSNTVFRSWLYGNVARFSEHHWTWEDMYFSRQLLEAGNYVIHDQSISVDTLYRASDRTEYGLWTEVSSVNTSRDFSVIHPWVKIWHLSVYQIFEHVSDLEIKAGDTKSDYLIQCLKDEFGGTIMDEETSQKLKIEIESGKWLLIPHVLNP